MKDILILGGSYAGISTAHRILKQSSKLQSFKITLVSPDTHFYWSMASPRGIVPGQLTDDELFQPILAGFNQYPASQFEFILASAEILDPDTKQVKISGPTGSKTLSYDFLILATGARTREYTPFKSLGSTKATQEALHDFQTRIKDANTIVIAGGGVTGVEVAGELGFEYGQQKKIILVASGAVILHECPTSVWKLASEKLRNLKVEIRLQRTVTSSVKMEDGRQELTLSTSEKLITDVYIPTFGLVPNSSYVPARFTNASGHVVVDEYLQVKGTADIWAIGDVSNTEPAQFITCDKQSTHLAKNIVLMLGNKPPLSYKVATSRFMGLQIGRNFGTGHWGSWKVPSFIITWARKTLFIENMGPTINGSLF